MWASPLKPKKVAGPTNKSSPTVEIEKFKPEKLTLTKTEAKKILDYKKNLSYHHIEWVQKYMETVIRENSYPPQLAGPDAYGQIMLFLDSADALRLLQKVREEFGKILPPEPPSEDEFAYLVNLELGAYHEHLPPPQTVSHNSQTQDDGPLLTSKPYKGLLEWL